MSVVTTKAVARLVGAVGGVLLIATAMTGCGKAATGGTSPAAQGGSGHGGLCARLTSVRVVRVARIPSLTQLEPAKPLPSKLPELTIADPAKARALARAVCALPPMPRGTFHCPVGFTGGYRIAFAGARGRALPAVSVQTGGCEQLTGAGPVRWAAHSPAFWSAFEHATGIMAVRHLP
jgi:hypothetical protein